MNSYHRMSIAEKQAHTRLAAREPAMACEICGTQVMPVDLLTHAEQRCPGPREPGPGAKWVTWREALGMGVLPGTLSRWVRAGKVRARGVLQERRYLLRDLAPLIARRLQSSSGVSDRKPESAP